MILTPRAKTKNIDGQTMDIKTLAIFLGQRWRMMERNIYDGAASGANEMVMMNSIRIVSFSFAEHGWKLPDISLFFQHVHCVVHCGNGNI